MDWAKSREFFPKVPFANDVVALDSAFWATRKTVTPFNGSSKLYFSIDDSGTEYITFKENPTKTRQGGLNTKDRPVLPKMFANRGLRCPVQLFKEYLSRRPPVLRESGPFYLAMIDHPKSSIWYKKQRLGVNSIDGMMKNLIKNTSLESSVKKLTNHSARKTLVKKLRAASVERQSIIQVTGHANERSLNDYDEGSEREQQRLSNIISSAPQSTVVSSQRISSPSNSSTGSQQTHGFSVNNFHNCQVTFNIVQGQSSSPVSLSNY